MGGNNPYLRPAHSAGPRPFAPAPGVGIATWARTERREHSIRGGLDGVDAKYWPNLLVADAHELHRTIRIIIQFAGGADAQLDNGAGLSIQSKLARRNHAPKRNRSREANRRHS